MADNKRYRHAQRVTEAIALGIIKLREIMHGLDTRRWVSKLEDANQTILREGGYSTRYLERWTNFDDALVDFSTNPVHCIVSRPVTLTQNTSIPSTVDLEFIGEGRIITAGFNFTTAGKIIASKDIFTFSGSEDITFTNLKIIDSAWFLSTQFSKLISSCGSNACQVIIDKDFTLTENTTIPSNAYINPVSGVINTGTYQLTINSPVVAQDRQIFDGFVKLNGITEVNIMWFGASYVTYNTSQDSATMAKNVKAFQMAFNTMYNGSLLLPFVNKCIIIDKTIVPGGYALGASLTSATTTSVVMNTPILNGTPQTGTLKIQNNNCATITVNYTSWTGSTFTISSTDFSGVNASAGRGVRVNHPDTDTYNWYMKGSDSVYIAWGGVANGTMFEVSNTYNTISRMEKIRLYGTYNENSASNTHAGIGMEYGRTTSGHFHYQFSYCTFAFFKYDNTSTPMSLYPNGNGTNGANDFEYMNCYFSFSSNGAIIGLPDQSFFNCTFQNVTWCVRMLSNSRASFMRCYLGALRAVFMVGNGAVGLNIKDTWFEQVGTMFEYVSPGTPCTVPAGVQFTDCRFASTQLYGAGSPYFESQNTLATALTGVTTSIVSTNVETKETTTAGGMPDKGRLIVYANNGTGYTVNYGSFNHGTKTFSSLSTGFRLATALTGVTTSLVVRGAIPAHTKTSGTLTVMRDSGSTLSVSYSSWSGSTFTISSTDFSGANSCRVGRKVTAEVDFTSVPANSGNLLLISRFSSFMDLRDFIGNLTIRGGDFASEMGPPNIILQHTDTTVTIEDVRQNNALPLEFLDTSLNALEGWEGSYIREKGYVSCGIKSRLDYSASGDNINFNVSVPTTGHADGAMVAYTGITASGVKINANRAETLTTIPSVAGIFATSLVSADNTLTISVFNKTGGVIGGATDCYVMYCKHPQTRLLD